MEKTPSLQQVRNQIDTIDQQIQDLLDTRFSYIQTIALLKEKEHLPIYDKKREEQIKKRFACVPSLEEKMIWDIWQQILNSSKEYQHALIEKKRKEYHE